MGRGNLKTHHFQYSPVISSQVSYRIVPYRAAIEGVEYCLGDGSKDQVREGEEGSVSKVLACKPLGIISPVANSRYDVVEDDENRKKNRKKRLHCKRGIESRIYDAVSPDELKGIEVCGG